MFFAGRVAHVSQSTNLHRKGSDPACAITCLKIISNTSGGILDPQILSFEWDSVRDDTTFGVSLVFVLFFMFLFFLKTSSSLLMFLRE